MTQTKWPPAKPGAVQFAGELRLRGIAAEASPRRTRGKVRKADREHSGSPQTRDHALCRRRAREEVLREAVEGKSAERPWEKQIQSRQEGIRRRYLDYASELERTGEATDQTLARQMREFVRDMPTIETRRHALSRELADFIKNRQRQRGAERKEDSGGHDKTRDGDREK